MRPSLADALTLWTTRATSLARSKSLVHRKRPRCHPRAIAAELLEDRALLAGEPIAGVVWNDNDADGVHDAGESGLGGQTLYLDLNKNGMFDDGAPVTTTVEPGDFANGTELTQAVPGVTLGAITSTGGSWDAVKALNGRFAHRLSYGTEATFWGSSFPTLVVAFDQPADFFSVDVTGFGATAASRAWLRAYNSAGTLIADFISDPLSTTSPTTITISATGIDHVLVSASTGVALLERLSFTTPIAEPTATTDANGAYAFGNLLNGNYIVRPIVPNGWEQSSAGNEENVYYATGYDGNRNNALALLKIHAETGQVTWIGNPLPTNLSGIVRTNDGRLFATSWQTDHLYEINPVTAQVTDRGAIGYQVVAGLAYDSRTDTLYTLGSAQTGINQLLILNRAVGRGLALGPGITGLVGTSGLAIDTANERVIAFDNNDGEFYEFRLSDGVARLLSTGPNVRTWGFSQGPQGFVLQAHGTGDGFLRGVNPETALLRNYSLAMSQTVRLESLDWNYDPKRYVIPYVRTPFSDVNFGVVDITPPVVTEVKYGYGTDKWIDPAMLAGRTAPWQINRIAISFDRDVVVDLSDLAVTGVNVASYAISAFAYDAATRTAVWTLATAINNDRITLTLDGDDASGDGNDGVHTPAGYYAGGDSIHSLDVLFGDVDGNGTVNLVDALLQRGRNGTSDIWADIDGNGTVNLIDALLLRGRNGTKLP